MHRYTTCFQAVVILAILVAATAIIAATGLDLAHTRFFYVPGAGFPYGALEPWDALYRYGSWPAFLLAGAALIVLVAGLYRQGAARHRRACIFLCLMLALGPGILVNSFFKEHWGRPRPRQVLEFGGTREFHQPWQFDTLPGCRSFPSGHASAAFYLMSPYFILRRSSRRWARRFLVLGLVFGTTVGMARVVQGGHFTTDVLWSGGLVYLSGLLLATVMRLDSPSPSHFLQERQCNPQNKKSFTGAPTP